jgi:hypothetical protein
MVPSRVRYPSPAYYWTHTLLVAAHESMQGKPILGCPLRSSGELAPIE